MGKIKDSKKIIEKLMASDFIFKDENGNIIDTPASGSLGHLAMGYKGLIAVRKKRLSNRNNKTNSPPDKTTTDIPNE